MGEFKTLGGVRRGCLTARNYHVWHGLLVARVSLQIMRIGGQECPPSPFGQEMEQTTDG